MKKVVIFCLSIVMLLSLSMTALAATGGFVSSPSRNPAPELIGFVRGTEGCTVKLKITSYADRDTLDAADRAKLEEAYDHIVGSLSSDDYVDALKKLAKDNNMLVNGISISDLFDISTYGCDDHDGHTGYTITIKADTIDSVVGLLHLNGDAWEIVRVDNVDEGNNTMTFYVETLSPFAIAVDNGNGSLPPATGDNSMIYVWAMIAAASGVLLILVCAKAKKQKA